MQDFLLRCHTIDISWEHRAFFDVGDAEEAGRDALEADGEAAAHIASNGKIYETLWAWKFNSLLHDYKTQHPFVN